MWGNKGILFSWLLLSAINVYHHRVSIINTLIMWELIISAWVIVGLVINYYLNKKTNHLRLLKITSGSAASLLAAGIFMPLIPGMILWLMLAGIPFFFTYRKIPAAFYQQIIFKFIFSTGWIIIGNILY